MSFTHAEFRASLIALPMIADVNLTKFKQTHRATDSPTTSEVEFEIIVELSSDKPPESMAEKDLLALGHAISSSFYDYPEIVREMDDVTVKVLTKKGSLFSSAQYLQAVSIDVEKETKFDLHFKGILAPYGEPVIGPEVVHEFTSLNGSTITLVGGEHKINFIQTINIPARKDVEFGVCYSLRIPLMTAANIRYTVSHPSMIDPDGIESRGYSRDTVLPRDNGLETGVECWLFVFEYDWEIAEGHWALKIFLDDQPIHTARFYVTEE